MKLVSGHGRHATGQMERYMEEANSQDFSITHHSLRKSLRGLTAEHVQKEALDRWGQQPPREAGRIQIHQKILIIWGGGHAQST